MREGVFHHVASMLDRYQRVEIAKHECAGEILTVDFEGGPDGDRFCIRFSGVSEFGVVPNERDNETATGLWQSNTEPDTYRIRCSDEIISVMSSGGYVFGEQAR